MSSAAPRQNYPIRRAIFWGLGGIVTLGMVMLVLSTWFQVNTSQSDNAAVLRSYTLLDSIRELQVAEETTRAAVFEAFANPTPSTLVAIINGQDVVRTTMRSLSRQGSGDAALTVAHEASAAAVNHWWDTWAAPIHDTLVRGGSIAADPDLTRETGEALFAQIRAASADLHDEAIGQMSARLIAVEDRTRAMSVSVGFAAILLCLGVLMIGRWLVRVVTGPLRRLNETAYAQLNGEQVAFRAERDDEVGALAVVLERLRLMVDERYAGAQEEARRAATLNKLGDLIAFSAAEFEVIDGTVRALGRLVKSRRGDVQLANASRNRLLYAGSWGPNPPALDTPVNVDRIDRCPAIRRAAPFVVPDVDDDLAVLCPAHRQETGSLACIPLIAMGQPIGSIHLESDEPITDEMIAVVMRLAEQVAVAIANARLMTTMEGLAMTDGLTGLRNARFFDSFLDQELAAAERDHEPLSVLMLDIDHFKQFNDTHGHPAGDEALRTFGRALRATLRSSDLAARYGGEEFMVALRHTDLEGAVFVAEKLRLAVSQAIVEIGPGRFGRLSVSIGVAEADLANIDQKGLVAAADAALYRAKSNGRNQVVVASRHPNTAGPGDSATPAAAADGGPAADAGGSSSEPPFTPAAQVRSVAPIPLAARRRRRPHGSSDGPTAVPRDRSARSS